MKEESRKANYGLGEMVSNFFSLVYTKIFWKKARLIRLPVRIRGKKAIDFGKGFTTGYSCRIEINGNIDKKKLIIGYNCIIGDYAHIVANDSVTIGNNVLLASRVFITDSNHGMYKGLNPSRPEEEPNRRPICYAPVAIGDNVWIGENVSIMPGVKIGNGCIIGANSVVTKQIPDNCIAAGIPARIIKKYDYEKSAWIR
ncbi:putative lipopolysaccharide biosynthesis O-acetyl transferase WbbJ [Claveliimonas bilis]|uniref:DapH/DapD/GlmU-related protein n=1 Tax=Claveliimonas bilis TaxID=3028070 RepID=UPI001E592C4F|nr:DapH/DapD/GlmU-related protein [Claveliimonas bilis]BCZ27058.1 putative lipopolysaccharide biosynthesis O-acetyl transferase WbbJ [Claveliimonas bilis]